MANIINGTDTGSGGLITTGDSSDELQLQTAEVARVTLTNTAVVVNESGADVDFRVEGDTDANLLFVDAGNDRVGVKTSAPAVAFDVVGQVRASTGILFGSDTAAANALDDYEEGSWTPGVDFDGASAGVTFGSDNSGVYTKVGRVVTAIGRLLLTSKGSSTGVAKITGLPFTVASSPPDANFSGVVALSFVSAMTFADIPIGRCRANTTTAELFETTNAGTFSSITNADFADTTNLRFTITYFV